VLYQAYQVQQDMMAPVYGLADLSSRWLAALPRPWSDNTMIRQLAATYEMVGRMRLTHERPPFRVEAVEVDGQVRPVREELVTTTPFAALRRFTIDQATGVRPRVLLVAAMAGHFPTLLRNTIRTLVADCDVYVTDWHNVRDVPLDEGPFALDDYIDHIMKFLERIGPGAHIFAVCQPCPAVIAATSLMAAEDHPCLPRSMTLMAGPVNCEVNATQLNQMAEAIPLSWFKHNLLTVVPRRYAGAGRLVYPGFLQIVGFLNLDIPRHVSQHVALYEHLLRGESDEAQVIETFYDEYFAVSDMAAEFYLDTVDAIFQRNLLWRGELTWRGKTIDPGVITRTALLTIEGANDQICPPGQTSAAQHLCSNIRPEMRLQHLQPGVGHYGVFSGSRWEREIYPVMRSFIMANDAGGLNRPTTNHLGEPDPPRPGPDPPRRLHDAGDHQPL
jgi:poly(3-hydroxybutyrate) depolymerase